MYWSNRSMPKNISWRKSLSSGLACNLKTLGRDPEIVSNQKIWTHGEHALVV